MRKAHYLELGKYLQTQVNQLKDTLAEWPLALRNLILSVYVQAAQSYLDAPEGRRLCWLICGVNTAIYLVWKIPRLAPFMTRSFTHHPLSGRSYTLLTSMFSHKSFIHLLANSMALASFGSAATHYFTLEQLKNGEHQQEATAKWHFLAFFISAGLFSGLVSHVAACKVLFPRLVNQYTASAVIKNSPAAAAISSTAVKTATAAPREILPSLGASGAIYAAVTVSALAFPDAQVSLIFPPFVSIPIQAGVGGLVMLDMIGIIRSWRMFDHYAHLGGATFGAMYYMYGPRWWAFMRSEYQQIHSPTS
jgi:rhomboid-like protein